MIKEYIYFNDELNSILEDLTKLDNNNNICYCYNKYYDLHSDCIFDLIENRGIDKNYSIIYHMCRGDSDMDYSVMYQDSYPEIYYFNLYIFPNCKDLDFDKILKMKIFL